jgi:CMP-2-keto-3-deoxyoctulosonic acid synthetase
MNITGSVIARLGSKRLTYKNILPYQGVPLVVRALQKLLESNLFDHVVLSTDSELIARTCNEVKGVSILKRPEFLSTDEVPSVPVFQHILENFPCDIHLNYNCNFPECDASVFEESIELAQQHGESLSVPYAVWSQTKERLNSYGDFMKLPEPRFESDKIHPVDIHTMDDLLKAHRDNQEGFAW